MTYPLRKIFVCLSVLCLVDIINGSSQNKTLFDQRQTGEYNIQISLKDIKIFALLSGGLGGPEDYDYNYDYSELTIKPPNGTKTTTPASTTVVTTSADISPIYAESTTERIVEITPATLPTSTKTHIDISNSTDSKNQTILTSLNSMNTTNQTVSSTTFRPLTVKPDYTTGIPVQVIVAPLERVQDIKRGSDVAAGNLGTSETSYFNTGSKLQRADCMEGFRKDRQGNCRPRTKKPHQQTLLRKLIQLSQRLQPARQKSNNN